MLDIAKAFGFPEERIEKIENALRLFADDVTWQTIGSTAFSGTHAGKQSMIEDLVKPLFGQLKSGIASTVHHLTAERDLVVAEVTGKAETKAGQPYNNTYCFVFRIHDEKIVEVREYLDTDLVNRAFGR